MGSHDFRLTFNKPAERLFFVGEDVVGVVVERDGVAIIFHTADEPSPNVLPAERRSRGGLEVAIEGKSATDLLDGFLAQGCSVRRPFFTLRRAKGGSAEAIHFDAEGAPPKFEPHVRVWMPRENVEPAIAELAPEIVAQLGEFALRVLAAKQTVDQHILSRKVGRPPREFREADILLDAFEELARQVLSNLGGLSDDDIKPIREARDLLTQVVERFDDGSSKLIADAISQNSTD